MSSTVRFSPLAIYFQDMSRRLDACECVWFGNRTIEADGTVSYTMPGVRFGFRVSGTCRVDVKMDTGGNFFKINLTSIGEKELVYDLNMHSVTSDGTLEWVRVASNLDPAKTYDITIIKKTEPELKSILSRYDPVRVKRVRAASGGIFHDVSPKQFFYPSGYIEVIGDSDACGFGVNGAISSTMNIFSIDGADEDCLKAWGSCLARRLGFGDSVVCTAWSGKGIARNAPMCGDACIPELWFKHHSTTEDELPKCIAILAGGNDFIDENYPGREEFIARFSELFFMIRKIRGQAVPIYVFQCGASCCSSAGSPSEHPENDVWAKESCQLLDEFTRDAVNACGGETQRIYYHQIQTKLDLATDYATMMHWSVSGQDKISSAMFQFISSLGDSNGFYRSMKRQTYSIHSNAMTTYYDIYKPITEDRSQSW